MSSISIVLPTLAGRERYLEETERAYRAFTVDHTIELIRIHDQPSWGEALNMGAKVADGDWLHFSCDDMLPHDGWDSELDELGPNTLAAPTIELPGGEVYLAEDKSPSGGPLCVLPVMRWAQWEILAPMLNIHYFADNAFTDRALAIGFEVVYPPTFRFKHLMAPGDNTMERREHDIEIYNAAIRFARLKPSLPMPHLGE